MSEPNNKFICIPEHHMVYLNIDLWTVFLTNQMASPKMSQSSKKLNVIDNHCMQMLHWKRYYIQQDSTLHTRPWKGEDIHANGLQVT